jgi:holliday junction DNA helicase RuvA
MIDFLRGEVVFRDEESIAVDVGGVGYRVWVANPFRFEEGEQVVLHTHLVVKEDAHSLYGFLTRDERDFFRLLLQVSGVGPKAAMTMLSGGSPGQLAAAIQAEDATALTRLPGIGKKTAQRLILELKDKVKKWSREFAPAVDEIRPPVIPPVSPVRDVIDALTGLGYNEEEAEWAAREALRGAGSESLPTEEWIRHALKALAR